MFFQIKTKAHSTIAAFSAAECSRQLYFYIDRKFSTGLLWKTQTAEPVWMSLKARIKSDKKLVGGGTDGRTVASIVARGPRQLLNELWNKLSTIWPLSKLPKTNLIGVLLFSKHNNERFITTSNIFKICLKVFKY